MCLPVSDLAEDLCGLHVHANCLNDIAYIYLCAMKLSHHPSEETHFTYILSYSEYIYLCVWINLSYRLPSEGWCYNVCHVGCLRLSLCLESLLSRLLWACILLLSHCRFFLSNIPFLLKFNLIVYSTSTTSEPERCGNLGGRSLVVNCPFESR